MTTQTIEPAAALPQDEFLKAFFARDFDVVAKQLAPDVVLRSPIISTPFEGKEEVLPLLQVVRGVFEELSLADEGDTRERHVAWFRGRIGRQQLQGVDLIERDDAGLVREMVILVRPMAGAGALAAALAAPVAGRRSRIGGLIARVVVLPQLWLLRLSDRIGAKLVLGRFSPRY